MQTRRIGFLLVLLTIGIVYALPPRYERAADTTGVFPPYTVKYVPVEPTVLLEVIDFGGTGHPVVLLAGLGATAHSFDVFAPKLAAKYHVYAITRRGFGSSSHPLSGYTSSRLGDDVHRVVDVLSLDRPILIGHSFGGAELSSVACRWPASIGGVVYMDAGYSYALYDDTGPHLAASVSRVLGSILPAIPRVFRTVRLMIYAGQERFTAIPVPALAIFASPHDLEGQFRGDPVGKSKAEEADRIRTDRQGDAFARLVPTSKVIRVPNASHVIYRTHEELVLRAIDSFVQNLTP